MRAPPSPVRRRRSASVASGALAIAPATGRAAGPRPRQQGFGSHGPMGLVFFLGGWSVLALILAGEVRRAAPGALWLAIAIAVVGGIGLAALLLVAGCDELSALVAIGLAVAAGYGARALASRAGAAGAPALWGLAGAALVPALSAAIVIARRRRRETP